MLPNFTRRRTARIVTLMLVGIALVGLVPVGPTGAQGLSQIQYLDNEQGDFTNGVFERTSISPEVNAALPEDKAGTVQLAPAGVLTRWGLAAEGMPTDISNYGLVALGDYLYTVGGELGTDSGGTRGDKVYRAKINRVTGNPDTTVQPIWKPYDIPAEQALLLECAGAGNTAAGRSRNGAASLQLPSGGNLGYIYVVGGFVDTPCAQNITTPLVQIATVNASGDITGWVKAPYLPAISADGTINTTPGAISRGLADPMVTIVRTTTNERFIYVIGGLSVDTTTSLVQRRLYRSVLYAKINAGNGSLVNPLDGSTTQPWAAAAPIDFVDTTKSGLRDGSAVTARLTSINNNSNPPVVSTIDAILVSGGCHDTLACSNLHPYVLKATITNPSTGAVTWDNTPSIDNQPVSLPARGGLGSVFYNGKLYLVGGTTTGLTTGGTFNVPTAVFNSNLEAIKIADGGEYFIGTGEADQVLPAGNDIGDTGKRTDVGVAVMPSLPPADQSNVTVNAAWVFVGGGYSSAADTPRVSSLIVGKVGGDDEAADTVRSRDGWYYSSIEPVSINNAIARVLTLRWSAAIDRSANTQADIIVEFRKTITADRQCQEEDFSPDASDRWRRVDGDTASAFFSKTNSAATPFNIIELDKAFPNEAFEATCLQFRAQFLQDGVVTDSEPSPAPGVTPKLLSFSLEKVLAGAADVKVNELSASRRGGSIGEITVAIENLSDSGLNDTLDVDKVTNKGSFFVHLCLSKGTSTFPTLTMPVPGSGGNKPGCAVAYYEVFNVQMYKGAKLFLPANGWRDPDPPYNAVDLRDLFNEPGRYTFGVVIDYVNVIPEGAAGELNNRGERQDAPNGLTANVEITAPRSYQVTLPFITR